jgi:site-specific recombinase XerD
MPDPLLDLASLQDSWQLHLQAESRSDRTVLAYMSSLRLFLRWCAANGEPADLSRARVQRYAAELRGEGKEATTIRLRLAALRQFSKWLADEGEIDENPLTDLKPPKLTVKVTQALSEDQLRALIKTCKGTSFRNKRDEAIIRLMAETGIRAAEALALTVDDVQPLKEGVVTIHKGKGGKGRRAPFGPQTAAALDRYLRVRRHHALADLAPLWLSMRGTNLGYQGLYESLYERARIAGIDGFHIHLFRHTAATRWLNAGGSEGGLMTVAGWSSRRMLDRYVAASAADRAAAEARGLKLGEL